VTAVADPEIAELDAYTGDTSHMKVHELLIQARRRIRAIGKYSRNTEQNYNFRGVDDVVNEASPIFADLGILILPLLESASYRDVRTSRDKPSREVTVSVTYRFIGPLGDSLDIKVPGESMDSGDKGTPKAMSVALRIALLQALMIPTRELHPDPDSQSYERADRAETGAAEREAAQPTRVTLLETVTTASTELRALLGIGEYEWLEWIAKVCHKDFSVNVIKVQAEGGPVEEIDMAKLRTNQLHILWNRLDQKLRETKKKIAADAAMSEGS
jgi:hypothetical protein